MKTESQQWQEVAKLAHDFLNSLPHGWLAHTSGDVGLLNDFYIKYRECKTAAAAPEAPPQAWSNAAEKP
jgi:hypothetical protein